MEKKEVSEIRRRFSKENATITRMSGCYVDAGKEKVLTFHKNFLNLPDEEFYKYLEIAKKTLGGTIGNQLIELEFPKNEEEKGGKQFSLMALRENALKSEPEVEAFFDLVVDYYDCASNYLILLFHDCYDVPVKASDETKIGESDEVYNYILCSICPVNLSKPALGYKQKENDIGARERDWVVSAPESGFIFPCFTDRATDIHSVMTFGKNTKQPHRELWEDILGCKPEKMTSDEKKDIFFDIVKKGTRSFTEEEGKEAEVKESVKVQMELAGENPQEALTVEGISEIFESAGIDEEKAKSLAQRCQDKLQDQLPKMDELVKPAEIKKIEDEVRKKELEKENAELKALLPQDIKVSDEKVVVSVSKKKETEIRFSKDSGVHYLMIPVEAEEVVMVNGKKKQN